MKMDDQFIVDSTNRSKSTSFNFFSKRTLNFHWQNSVHGNIENNFIYDKGLLLVYLTKKNDKSEEYGVIQLYDVASRTYLREMCITVKCDIYTFQHKVGLNSKFMVVAQMKDYRAPYKMNIYDLEAVKNPKSTEDELLINTLVVETYFDWISVDEGAIMYGERNQIRILDFSFLEYFRNATNSSTLSLPWRSVWRSKGVDEEPLKPARHMEVYTEVLKYFHQLSMDCQTAIDSYQVVDPDAASLTLGDDFISYRHFFSKMVIFDENMKKMCLNTIHKFVQISKNMHVSVMGKTIWFFDTATGDVINEMKLERNAIGFHLGGNLLVCVSKLGEHEHILSVWKIGIFLNLTHIKDLPIGDCHPHVSEKTLQLDENLIAVRSPNEHGEMTFNFISLKSFQVERLLSCLHHCCYDGGYLFIRKGNKSVVRMLDVVSGTFLRNMSIDLPSYGYISRVNSNYVVISSTMSFRPKSKLYVYDLKCLKETDAVPTHLLLTTIELDGEVVAMRMNETRIVCLCGKNMFVVDLKPIDRLRSPESC